MCLFGLYSFSYQSCTPVHSLFENESILENPLQIFTNLFFNAYLEVVLKLLSESLSGKTFRFERGFGEDSSGYLT